MKEYLVKPGPDCLVAVDETGFAKQIADIRFALKCGGLEPDRAEHLQKLHDLMSEISKEELPKKIQVPD